MAQMQQLASSVFNQIKNASLNHPLKTLAIGVGVAIVAPTVLPIAKPLAKAAIKGGVSLYEKTKGAIAETGEAIGDIVAEAKAEVAAEQAKKITLVSDSMNVVNTSNDSQ